MWKEERSGNPKFLTAMINAVVKLPDASIHWKLTGFYGNLVWAKRKDSWELLSHLKIFPPKPWFCVGDFNEIVDQAEKSGAVLQREGQMEQFRTTLENCNLSDLGFKGSKFTWRNYRSDESFMKERLERVVANHEWCMVYRAVEVNVLAA